MRQLFSRLVSVLFIAITALSLPGSASAQARPHLAKGGAQFFSPNDFVGTGNATHLGRYSEVGHVEFSPTSNAAVLAVSGWNRYTAANGAELHAVISGELNTVTGVITATLTYVGGTGRFAGASGSSSLAGQMLGGGAAQVTVVGSIDY